MNRLIYCCEPTFDGFLTAVFYAYKNKCEPEITSQIEIQPQIGDVIQEVNTDFALSERVKKGIFQRDNQTYEAVCLAYANYNPQRESIIFAFLQLFFEKGKVASQMFNVPSVIAFQDLVKQTELEVRRFRGFLRFREMSNGAFYGVIEPDNDILQFLLPHFCDRFNSQKFVIHDSKRAKIAVYDGEKTLILNVEGDAKIILSDEESNFLALWKKYVKSVNIKQRQNLRLQNAFLPKRYRGLMSEFEEE